MPPGFQVRTIAIPLLALVGAGGSALLWKRLETKPAIPAGIWQASATQDFVKEVKLTEGQAVRKGQLLLVLDDRDELAALKKAEENLKTVLTKAKSADVAIVLTGFNDAPILGASFAEVPAGPIISKRTIVDKVKPDTSALEAEIIKLKSAVAMAGAVVKSAPGKVSEAKAALATAQTVAESMKSAAEKAKTEADAATQKAQKNAQLLEMGAVSQRVADKYKEAAQAAEATLQSANHSAAAAEGAVQQRELELKSLESETAGPDPKVKELSAKLAAKQAELKKILATPNERTIVVDTMPRRRMLRPLPIPSAPAEPQPVEIDMSAMNKANAEITKARGQLREAQQALEATRIYAERTGLITAIQVQAGMKLAKGAQIVKIASLGQLRESK